MLFLPPLFSKEELDEWIRYLVRKYIYSLQFRPPSPMQLVQHALSIPSDPNVVSAAAAAAAAPVTTSSSKKRRKLITELKPNAPQSTTTTQQQQQQPQPPSSSSSSHAIIQRNKRIIQSLRSQCRGLPPRSNGPPRPTTKDFPDKHIYLTRLFEWTESEIKRLHSHIRLHRKLQDDKDAISHTVDISSSSSSVK